jgi:protein-arginine kinase activator protein McsA
MEEKYFCDGCEKVFSSIIDVEETYRLCISCYEELTEELTPEMLLELEKESIELGSRISYRIKEDGSCEIDTQ